MNNSFVKQRNLVDMPKEDICPCGGGQSCIVDRRWIGDWVHEDILFINAGLEIRKNCSTKFTNVQENILRKFLTNV